MSYDTALPFRSLYGGYVRRETDVALRSVPAPAELLMGLPAFHTDNAGHRASAETVAAAIRGVRLGPCSPCCLGDCPAHAGLPSS